MEKSYYKENGVLLVDAEIRTAFKLQFGEIDYHGYSYSGDMRTQPRSIGSPFRSRQGVMVVSDLLCMARSEHQ